MATETIKKSGWDWREDYVVCEHVAADADDTIQTKHSGFRVCCPACYEAGFLIGEIKSEERGKLSVGRLLTETELQAERSARISKRLRKSGLYR